MGESRYPFAHDDVFGELKSWPKAEDVVVPYEVLQRRVEALEKSTLSMSTLLKELLVTTYGPTEAAAKYCMTVFDVERLSKHLEKNNNNNE
jgi:hypothetical protein